MDSGSNADLRRTGRLGRIIQRHLTEQNLGQFLGFGKLGLQVGETTLFGVFRDSQDLQQFQCRHFPVLE